MEDNGFALFRRNSIKLENHKTKRKGKDSCCIVVAVGHNKRVPQYTGKGEIDPARSHLNYPLLEGLPSDPDGVKKWAKSLLDERGYIPPRMDSIVATECLFSLPEKSSISLREYFSDCAKWAREHFGGIILSADVHLDESSPHCHVIILLPLAPGSKSGSRMIGNQRSISEQTRSFYETVAKPYGLTPPPSKLTGQDRKTAAESVIARMHEDADAALVSTAWPAIEASIREKPERFMRLFGIDPPPAKKALPKTIRELATSKGKGPKTAAAEASQDYRLAEAWMAAQSTAHGATADAYRHSATPIQQAIQANVYPV